MLRLLVEPETRPRQRASGGARGAAPRAFSSRLAPRLYGAFSADAPTDELAGAASALDPIIGVPADERAALPRARLEVRPVPRLERLAVERLAPERAVDFFAAPRVERDAGFFAADFEAEEREAERPVFFAADFFAAPRDAVRPVDFFAADFFAAPPRVERDADFRAVDRPPRPADFALDLAVAFLVPEDFEDLPDLPLDAFLPAAMSRSFLFE